MSFNSEKRLIDLKSELAKAEAVLKSPEYIKREKEYDLKLGVAIENEVAEKGYTTIQNIASEESLHVCDLIDEILELEQELSEKTEKEHEDAQLSHYKRIVDSETGVVIAITHSTF